MSTHARFDYVVIGAGSAGCVVANRLSADGGTKVLLLEAGGPDTKPEIHDPAGLLGLWGSDVDWSYLTEPQAGLEGRQIFLSRGKVLGGSSAINALIYIRGNRRDFDHWNYLGNEGWSFEEVLPAFKKSEQNTRGASEYHGADGSLRVADQPDPTPVAHAFAQAGPELGFGGPDWDFNGAQQENGTGLYQMNLTAEGTRCSAAVAFVKPVLNRPNLTIETGAHTTRIVCENGRVAGVEYVQNGTSRQVGVDREAVLCAGSIDSPKLLMLSGIGPADRLRAHGIPVVLDAPGVGENLQDHLLLPVFYKSKRELPIPRFIAEAGLFTRTRAGIGAAAPDLQFHFSAGIPAFVPKDYPFDGPSFAFVPILVRPQSLGSVGLRSARPEDPAVIQPNYLQADADLDVLVRGVHLAREIANTRAFAEFTAVEAAPGTGTSDGELRHYIRTHCSTVWHVAGTCRMGHDRLAVVDPQLRVHGIDGLRVADASVMPSVVAGNTHAACVMIGEKAAEYVLGAVAAGAAA